MGEHIEYYIMGERIEYSPDYLGKDITNIIVLDDGTMWARNWEYSFRINYNPYTGEAAPSQVDNFRVNKEP